MWIILLIVAVVVGALGIAHGASKNKVTATSICLPIIAVSILASGLYVVPQYNVWQQGLSGQAQLAKAQQNRQITIEEAEAIKESSQFLADAEVIRAHGVAEANKIVANGLGGPEGYLRYLYIEGLKQAEANGDKIIYIPTEAGLPILEAGRFNQRN